MKNHMFSKSLLAAAAAVALGAMAAGANADTITGFQTVTTGTPAPVNLTTQGTVDWFHYVNVANSHATLVTKNVASHAISNVTTTNTNNGTNAYVPAFTWTDGQQTGHTTGTNDHGAAQASNTGKLTFTVTPDGQAETLTVYAGYYYGANTTTNTFTDSYKLASLSTPFTLTQNFSITKGARMWVDTINFTAASTDKLTVTIGGTATVGNAWYSSATLADTPQAPEPASLAMLGVGAVGLLLTRRRKVFA